MIHIKFVDTNSLASEDILSFYGNWRFITVFTKVIPYCPSVLVKWLMTSSASLAVIQPP